jgi:hypothetical protein
MDCKLVPYGESEKRCVKCGYITWNNEKSDKEIIDDMIAMGYPVPNCRENTTKCECGANTSCQCGPEETNDSIEIDYSKVIKVQPRMVRESFPKEEPTLEEEYLKDELKKYEGIDVVVLNKPEEPKQETLEESAKRYATDMSGTYYEDLYNAFINGAKWQQERMYSEEDMIAFGKSCFYKGFDKAENDDANCYTAFRTI